MGASASGWRSSAAFAIKWPGPPFPISWTPALTNPSKNPSAPVRPTRTLSRPSGRPSPICSPTCWALGPIWCCCRGCIPSCWRWWSSPRRQGIWSACAPTAGSISTGRKRRSTATGWAICAAPVPTGPTPRTSACLGCSPGWAMCGSGSSGCSATMCAGGNCITSGSTAPTWCLPLPGTASPTPTSSGWPLPKGCPPPSFCSTSRRSAVSPSGCAASWTKGLRCTASRWRFPASGKRWTGRSLSGSRAASRCPGTPTCPARSALTM